MHVRTRARADLYMLCKMHVQACIRMRAPGNLLILDLRPFEEYERCHIYGAMHYDRTSLSKAKARSALNPSHLPSWKTGITERLVV